MKKQSIDTLITKLKLAEQNKPNNKKYYKGKKTWVPEHCLEWERAPFKPIAEHLGIPKQALPKAKNLKPKELELLLQTIIDTFFAYHWVLDVPDNLPDAELYNRILSQWNSREQYLDLGYTHFMMYKYDEVDIPEEEEEMFEKFEANLLAEQEQMLH